MQEGIYDAEMDREGISDKRSKRALMSKLAESISATRDKPKRPLIVVLATLLGGMLGARNCAGTPCFSSARSGIM